jgi:hypothetical protein
VFFWGNPTNKTVTGTAYTWELLIADHLDQSFWSTNQKYVKSNLLHSFLEVQNYVVSFTSLGKLHEFGAEKSISWAKPAHFDFFTINFTVWSHIPSTGGNALSTSCHKYQLQEEKHSWLGTTTNQHCTPPLYRYHMGLNQILLSAIVSSTRMCSHTHTKLYVYGVCWSAHQRNHSVLV